MKCRTNCWCPMKRSLRTWQVVLARRQETTAGVYRKNEIGRRNYSGRQEQGGGEQKHQQLHYPVFTYWEPACYLPTSRTASLAARFFHVWSLLCPHAHGLQKIHTAAFGEEVMWVLYHVLKTQGKQALQWNTKRGLAPTSPSMSEFFVLAGNDFQD